MPFGHLRRVFCYSFLDAYNVSGNMSKLVDLYFLDILFIAVIIREGKRFSSCDLLSKMIFEIDKFRINFSILFLKAYVTFSKSEFNGAATVFCLAALLTNLNEVGLLSDVAQAIHDHLERLEVTQVSRSSCRFIELSEGWLFRCVILAEHGQEVLVVADGSSQVRLASPGCGDPILEGLKASHDGDVPGTSCVFLDMFRGVLLEVLEGHLGQLTADNDFSQVRNLSQDFLKLSRTFGEYLLLLVLRILCQGTLRHLDQFILCLLSLLSSCWGAFGVLGRLGISHCSDVRDRVEIGHSFGCRFDVDLTVGIA